MDVTVCLKCSNAVIFSVPPWRVWPTSAFYLLPSCLFCGQMKSLASSNFPFGVELRKAVAIWGLWAALEPLSAAELLHGSVEIPCSSAGLPSCACGAPGVFSWAEIGRDWGFPPTQLFSSRTCFSTCLGVIWQKSIIAPLFVCSLFQHYCYTRGGMRHTSYTCICGR